MHLLTIRSLKLAIPMIVMTLTMTAGAAAQGFKPYPGASKYTPPDTPENREMMKAIPAGTTGSYFTTPDSYEKVVAFYKTVGKEYQMKNMPSSRKLPSGQELKMTFIIFDGAADIMASKHWAKIQHPFIGEINFKGAGGPEYKDIRDQTEIVVTDKK
jgi:hypothetical protein